MSKYNHALVPKRERNPKKKWKKERRPSDQPKIYKKKKMKKDFSDDYDY